MIVRLHVAPHTRGWSIRREGHARAWRVFPYQATAERQAMLRAFHLIRTEPRLTGWQVYVHGPDGLVTDSWRGGIGHA